jgi:hypothetical protein
MTGKQTIEIRKPKAPSREGGGRNDESPSTQLEDPRSQADPGPEKTGPQEESHRE